MIRPSPESLDKAFARYRKGSAGRTSWSRWFWYLRCQPGTTLGFVVSGLGVAVLAALLPTAFARLAGDPTDLRASYNLGGVVLLMAGAQAVRSLLEYRLVLQVRFVAYRTAIQQGVLWPPQARRELRPTVGALATQPMQISQFSYVADILASALGSVIVVVAIWVQFGWISLASTGVLACSSLIAIRLVHRIGIVYERWLASEEVRISAIGEYSRQYEPLRRLKLAERAAEWVHGRRLAQGQILRERSLLQMASRLNSSLAVYVSVLVAALLAAWRGTEVTSLVPLLVSSSLLFSYLDETIANYRVVRFTLPVLRIEDSRSRELEDRPPADFNELEYSSDERIRTILVESADDRLAFESAFFELRRSGVAVSLVPVDPVLDPLVLEELWRTLSPVDRGVFEEWCSKLQLPSDLRLDSNPRRVLSLSNGERHRLALALCLLDRSKVLFLEETFASLDPTTERRVREFLALDGPACVLVSSAVEAVDGMSRASDASGAVSTASSHDVDLRKDNASEALEGIEWANPVPGVRDAYKVSQGLFGQVGQIMLVVSGLAAAAGLVLFPAFLEGGLTSLEHAAGLVLSLLLLTMGLLGMSNLEYRAPIFNVDLIHSKLSSRLPLVARPQTSDQLIGRMGSDLGSLQMEVPSSLASAGYASAQLLIYIGAFIVGSPFVILVIAAAAPIFVKIYLSGERRLQRVASNGATARNAYHEVAGQHISNRFCRSVRVADIASAELTRDAETSYLDRSWDTALAMTRRTAELSTMRGLVLIAGLVLMSITDGSQSLNRVVVAYFIYELGIRASTIIEALQGASLGVATALRVEYVLRATALPVPLPHRSDAALSGSERIWQHVVDPTICLIGVSGPTGVGKSTALAVLQSSRCPNALYFGSDLPLSVASPNEYRRALGIPEVAGSAESVPVGGMDRSERQRLLAELASNSNADVVLLDESFNAMSIALEADTLQHLRALAGTGQTFVVVSHRDHSGNPSFDQLVDLE